MNITLLAANVRPFLKHGWFQIDNGYLVAWTVDGRNMSIIRDPMAVGTVAQFKFPHEPEHILIPDRAELVMIDGERLATLDGMGKRLTEYNSQDTPPQSFNWRGISLGNLSTAVVTCSNMVPHCLPGVLMLDPDMPCATYVTYDSKAVFIRQRGRPDFLGMFATMRNGAGLPLPTDWT